jgi:hypothetical protein
MYLNDLNLQKAILDKLKLNDINSTEELLKMSRKELKLLGFSYEEINLIAIKLQLIGMDLNKRKSSD